MAAFQFSIEQVSYSPEVLVETTSLDSLNSVIDPNVDFVVVHADQLSTVKKSEDVTEEWKATAKYSLSKKSSSLNKNIMENKKNSGSSLEYACNVDVDNKPKCSNEATNPSYPIISLPVANCMNQNNPALCEEAEKYFASQAFYKNGAKSLWGNQAMSPSSPLHSMCNTSEALALQESVIGNSHVKPVSAEVVAEVVERTKLHLQQGAMLNTPDPATTVDHISSKSVTRENSCELCDSHTTEESAHSLKQQLIRYPSESISSTVERRSWFSSSSVETADKSLAKLEHSILTPQRSLSRRSPSQSSINSVGSRKSHKINSNVPGVHSSKGITPAKDCVADLNFDSLYEKSLDNSIGYETESSVSEKFELESLCSETYETESNISELSGIGDDMFQFGKFGDNSLVSNREHNLLQSRVLKECGIQVNAVTLNATTSPMKSISSIQKRGTNDKCTLTEEHYFFELLREKASLEGQLENVTKENSDLLKERDNFSSIATNLEAQLKSLQNQLQTSATEKNTALKNLDAQVKEHRNWDNVIKEYQNIIETKNSEIKGLKDDLTESEQANIQVKVCFEELKVDMDSRDAAVIGLKKKIAELHVQVQLLLEGKIQLKNEVSSTNLEMETLQKSKVWYQEQLHATQSNRNKLHQQLILVQANEANHSNSLEKATLEINQLKQQLTETQQRAVKEKEVLMKHLETIEADMKERESMFEEIQKDKGDAESMLAERIRKVESEKSNLSNMTYTISDLEHQLSVLKVDNDEKDRRLKAIDKEKAELSKRIVILQKSSNEKDLNMQQQSQQIRDINVKMSHTEMALSRSEELVATLNMEKTAIDVALAAANEEKRIVDESLRGLGENLNKFQNNFKHMKAELLTKSAQAEQLLKEKMFLEESARKSEESLFFLKKEFAEKMNSESHNRDVMFDDIVKQKKDIQSILDVYSKDLLNFQQLSQNLEKEKRNLHNELSRMKITLKCSEDKIKILDEENINLRENITNAKTNSNVPANIIALKQEDKSLQIDSTDHDIAIYKKKNKMYKSNIKVLTQKLREKMLACENLNQELKKKEETYQQITKCSNCCQSHDELLEFQIKCTELEQLLKDQKIAYDDQANLIKKSEEVIIELEREKGKATGLVDSYNALKLRATELESKASEKDSQIAQRDCLVKELNNRLAEMAVNFKDTLASMESELNKEKVLIKSLRQQVFQEKRANSNLQRHLSSQKSALEQANHFADAKKQEINVLQGELSLKLQAELQHRAKEEQFQTEMGVRQAEIDKLAKELQDVMSRDPALAEQLKSLSWHLKEKSNEASALKEKLKLIEERHVSDIEGLKMSLQKSESELEFVKKELDATRKEKFSYQSKFVELRKALKIKLKHLESKGIVKMENKVTSNGSFIEFNIPDPETSFDESYINSLLEKSMNLSESRPLSNLQECLNSLKQEMVQLQKKISDSTDPAS